MPTMKQGTRGGPANENVLRNIGNKKAPTVAFGLKAWLSYEGIFVQTPIIYAMDRITAVFFKRGLSFEWTSIVRDEGNSFSLHPLGFAVDADAINELPEAEWKDIGDGVAFELGPQYDILVHNAGSGMHLHTEYDPVDDESWQREKAAMRKGWGKRHAESSEESSPSGP